VVVRTTAWTQHAYLFLLTKIALLFNINVLMLVDEFTVQSSVIICHSRRDCSTSTAQRPHPQSHSTVTVVAVVVVVVIAIVVVVLDSWRSITHALGVQRHHHSPHTVHCCT